MKMKVMSSDKQFIFHMIPIACCPALTDCPMESMVMMTLYSWGQERSLTNLSHRECMATGVGCQSLDAAADLASG